MKANKDKVFSTIIAVTVVAIIVFLATRGGDGGDVLRIVSTNDLAGLLVNQAAGATDDVQGIRLADCCGTQAEMALEAGVFDIAVICPDAAELFLQGGNRPFVLWGSIVENSSVLVSITYNVPSSVGYTFGRSSQHQIAQANLGQDVAFVPMNTLALPYALARGAVDAVVLDVLTATNAVEDAGLIIRPLPYNRPSSVLLVHQDVVYTQQFADFIENFNQLIQGEELAKWKEFYVNFPSLPRVR
ncbi:MAG: ABC transporter substrate-binding protein [Defluviitaleaceae bacterium]|nr:ABC transporter substrate-binding protein [Defluviitaleaceae bacterium]